MLCIARACVTTLGRLRGYCTSHCYGCCLHPAYHCRDQALVAPTPWVTLPSLAPTPEPPDPPTPVALSLKFRPLRAALLQHQKICCCSVRSLAVTHALSVELTASPATLQGTKPVAAHDVTLRLVAAASLVPASGRTLLLSLRYTNIFVRCSACRLLQWHSCHSCIQRVLLLTARTYAHSP